MSHDERKSLHSLVSEPTILLSLEPEELAGILLEHLNFLSDNERFKLNRRNFSSLDSFKEYPQEFRREIAFAFMEAWSWLEREGLIAPKPGQDRDWEFITRRGRNLRDTSDVEAYRKTCLLPRELLHPVLAEKVWPPFVRGEYDTAVFQAFKEVEVAIRTAGGFDPTDIGIKLMRKALDKSSGLLADPELPEPEREAMSHLFAGAIGYHKNPHSHRNVRITDSTEAIEMIMLASHLLRIVDARVAELNQP